ncbi:MAG: hypothetical protein HXX08_06265 [Chloroflexi bacterium]|uniref:Uncharacterized protein n=1 Tax=Candidatus Chlorohelix allophototropha TaxID=3003348 RepID=A0A8T7M2Q2_9CHLR|nr:hypothetical protein [Chloroflexota bacterium]WJW67340.1 hypothetical protein OZ401_000602 [Chloroflexota bacterium L227-S17]
MEEVYNTATLLLLPFQWHLPEKLEALLREETKTIRADNPSPEVELAAYSAILEWFQG